MKRIHASTFVGFAALLFAAPASADRVIQLWECELEKDATYEQLVDVSKRWTAAVRSIEGAEDIECFVEFPLAADAEYGDFTFVLAAPSGVAWGMFEDGYEGSEAEAIDEEWRETASCEGSSLWRSVPLQ